MHVLNTQRLGLATAALTATLSLAACSGDNSNNDSGAQPTVPENTSEMATNYAAIVHASYEDSRATAQELDEALEKFVDDPSDTNLTAARKAWLDSREPYLQTEVYRFYGGPIDDEDGPEGLINAWPLDESYIDYTMDSPMSGIVNSPDVTIDFAELESLNEAGGEKNIATGYHAIEFLLWGQDTDPNGPGDRPATDYLTDGTSSAPNPNRRGTYLTTSSELMITHLQSLEDDWAPDSEDNYRAEFVAAEPSEVLRRVLTGMIILSGFETGGERLEAALENGDQEDEHSCFSDNTHRDMIQDVRGIQNVYLGVYERTDGTTIDGVGVRDVIAERDPELAQQIEDQIAKSLAAAKNMKTPFDQEIALDNSEGRARVQALIDSLRAQEDLLEDAFRLFELSIPQPE